ncbi:glutamate receptor 2.8-like isoform X1 [Prunus avium]|uniref:Glutamate receptor n=1 Tax=Prunus avium TaxID=42229 RepID=A0A6P5TAE8_PRUAV|nr:glutamate receptor 2.8-like isoform X1 [Prunus avium]XP_021824216.1 glutamate receptor 2.8-like isoform X1 [Prunus avium]XP_021824223.1 glutamate receptor 2.8-like isoform X1 [Prunus avium]
MTKCPPNPVFLLFLFFRIFLVMALNTTIPINVGVVLDLDTRFGIIRLSCINMALSDFYASHSNYNTRLVLHTRDSARDVVVAADAALDLIKNVEVQAIIGLESSMQANFVIDLGDQAQVPIISFSATSPSLRGSYFFRIAQNDSSQVRAIGALIQAFGWREAVPVSIDNEFGEGLTPYLTTALQEVGAGIPYWSLIPSMATDDQIIEELHRLMSMQTRVFIVHMSPSLGSRFFAKARDIGMMEEGNVWITTNGMTNSFSSSSSSVDIDNMQGVLGIKTNVPNTKELENFRARWQTKFQQDNPTILNVKLDVFGLWAYDAAWALALAVEKVGGTNFSFQKMNSSHNSTDLGSLEVSQGGPELVRELSGTRFKGLSGDFSLINGQLQSSTFQVVNVNDNGERGIGYWTPQNGLVRNINSNRNTNRYSTSNASLGPVIWPGDTILAPRGWQIRTNGTLKVLVPLKQGFEELVSVVYDPSTNTAKVNGGYCIEVFDAVIKALPYPVPYEFYPFANPNGRSAGSYNDLINQVFLGNYDAAVGDITIRANRSLYVDFTLPFTESGISMVVPLKGNDGGKNTWVFLKPLTWDLWVTIGCFFIFIGFVVWFLEHRINEDFRGPPHHQIGTSFWFAFSTMVFAHREQVVSNLGRFVVIIWCFVVLVLTQSYTASLSSILTIQQLQPIVTDVNLLLKNGDNVGYQEGYFIYGILSKLGFKDDKLRTYNSAEELDKLLQNGNENGGISAAFDETPYMKLFLATNCLKYTLVEPTFKADGFALVFQKGSLLTRDVSTAITQVQEGDKMKAIEDKWFKKTESCSNPNTASSYDTLSLESFWGLFIVAGVASSLALLIFAAMFLYEHSHILTCVDSKASFWTRIRQVLRAYDQQDKTWHAYKKSRKEDGVHGIAAVQSSPNTNCLCLRRPSRSSKPNQIEPEIVLEEQEGTTSTQHSDLNPNATELTSIT